MGTQFNFGTGAKGRSATRAQLGAEMWRLQQMMSVFAHETWCVYKWRHSTSHCSEIRHRRCSLLARILDIKSWHLCEVSQSRAPAVPKCSRLLDLTTVCGGLILIPLAADCVVGAERGESTKKGSSEQALPHKPQLCSIVLPASVHSVTLPTLVLRFFPGSTEGP